MSKIHKTLFRAIIILMAALILLASAGCSRPTVVGVWIRDVPEQTATYDVVDDKGYVKTEKDGTAKTTNKVVAEAYSEQWVFEDDGTLTVRNAEGEAFVTYRYTVTDGVIKLTFTGDFAEDSGETVYNYTFSEKGNILTLAGDVEYVELHREGYAG